MTVAVHAASCGPCTFERCGGPMSHRIRGPQSQSGPSIPHRARCRRRLARVHSFRIWTRHLTRRHRRTTIPTTHQRCWAMPYGKKHGCPCTCMNWPHSQGNVTMRPTSASSSTPRRLFDARRAGATKLLSTAQTWPWRWHRCRTHMIWKRSMRGAPAP